MSELRPLPCAYCGVVPNIEDYCDFFGGPVTERWAEKGCFVCHQFAGAPIEAWNEDQVELLELRRQDYLAGFYNGALKSFDDYIKECQRLHKKVLEAQNRARTNDNVFLTLKKERYTRGRDISHFSLTRKAFRELKRDVAYWYKLKSMKGIPRLERRCIWNIPVQISLLSDKQKEPIIVFTKEGEKCKNATIG